MKQYVESLFSLFYPQTCENCSRPLIQHEDVLCLHCYQSLPKTDYHLQQINPLNVSFKGRAMINNAYAFLKFNKKGIAQNLVHKLKYKNGAQIGELMGRWMAQDLLRKPLPDYDAIIPVPLHKTRRRSRGYNQAEKICIGLSDSLGVKLENRIIKRTQNFRTQTKKGKVDRWQDADQLYTIDKLPKEIPTRVLVVDDVITTGATIAGAVNLLHENGFDDISIACFATGK